MFVVSLKRENFDMSCDIGETKDFLMREVLYENQLCFGKEASFVADFIAKSKRTATNSSARQ